MIDFIKFRISEVPSDILNNSFLDFSAPTNTNTGEIRSNRYGYIKQTCKFQNMVFEYIENIESKSKYIDVSGSLHKYCQGNNYTDFTLVELQKSIIDISKVLGIDITTAKVHRLEFGVNISSDYSSNNILNSIICYRGQPFELRAYKGNGYLKRFSFSQYDVKIYNKALQYGLNANILRFELKVNRMDFLLKKGVQILCIADLLQISIHQQLRNLLESGMNNLYFVDYRIDLKQISNRREKLIIIEGSNPVFWNKYRESHTSKGYQKKVKRFKELNLIYSPSNLQTEIKEMILAKWDQLSCTPILPSVQNTKVTHFDTHIVVGNNKEPIQRSCLTCGRDISHQKANSKFCSEKLFGRDVKKCRNMVSNFKKHEEYFYKNQTLFDRDLFLLPIFVRIKEYLKHGKV